MPPSEAGFNRPARSASSSAMSDARSEPTSLQQLFRHDAALSGTRPPPPSYPPLPQQVEGCKGVWSLNDDEIYGCDYPPVQTYLKQVRKAKRLVDPPSDVIWTLAALDVLYYPNDVAHWLFWSNDVYERHAKAVDAVARTFFKVSLFSRLTDLVPILQYTNHDLSSLECPGQADSNIRAPSPKYRRNMSTCISTTSGTLQNRSMTGSSGRLEAVASKH